jgi:hypothetical protein
MSGFGSFSQEAYEQLQQAYAAQLQKAEETEEQGVKIGSDTLGVETAPVRSAWLDKTGLWQYPDGRGERQDVEQKQQDLLAALRDSEGNLPAGDDDEELELSDMSDEELDAMIDEVLAEIESDEEAAAADLDDEDPEFDALVQQMLEGIDEDTSDEEIDAMLDELLGPADDEEDEDVEPEPEDDGEPDADDIAARIAELKAELAALTEDGDEEEEEEAEEDEDYAPEETQGEEEEETESEDDTADDEEVTSDDEPN